MSADPPDLPLRLKAAAHPRRGPERDPGPGASERAARRRSADPHIAATIERMLAAAQQLLLSQSGGKVSVKDVCNAAGVSRGTLYRYFASMEEILDALALRLRDQTDEELRRAVNGRDDPGERFEAFFLYMITNDETVRAARLLDVEPAFVLEYLRSNFQHFKGRVTLAMAPVFEDWEARQAGPIDREAISEMMVRYVLSELVVPTPPGSAPLALRLRPIIEAAIRRPRA